MPFRKSGTVVTKSLGRPTIEIPTRSICQLSWYDRLWSRKYAFMNSCSLQANSLSISIIMAMKPVE